MTGSPSVIGAMYAGLAMTVIAMVVPYIDHATSNTLANHIRVGYPTYTHTRIDTAATTYLVYLSTIGVLGVVGWLWTVRAIKTGKRWARVPRPHCSAPLPGRTTGRHPPVEKAAAKAERMSPIAVVVSMTWRLIHKECSVK
jgi:hypothetical protein